MIEVLFGDSEAGAMKAAKSDVVSVVADGPTAAFTVGKKKPPQRENAAWIPGTADEVICLAFWLDIGDIRQDVTGEYRKKLILSMLNQGQWGEDPEMEEALLEAGDGYIREMERLAGFLEDGEAIRIWYSRSAYSLCGLYYVCSLLSHYPNRILVVELPEYRVTKNAVHSSQNWGEIAADEFALYLTEQREISPVEISRYAMLWMDLVKDNSPLRAVINNRVVGVQEDFYDFLIWKHLTEEPLMQAKLIGRLLGQYQIGIGDWWYAKRIQHYIDNGKIQIIEDSENKYARLIKIGL